MTPQARALAGTFRAYQLLIRPLTGSHCRHTPSCSHYGIEAVTTHGAARGLALTARRVLRCHPWSAAGYDPVPSPSPSSNPGLARGKRTSTAG